MAIWFWRGVRWLFAAFFLFVGGQIMLSLISGGANPYHQPNAAAQAFADAIDNSGFLPPALAACYIAGALALLWQRTAPLGLAILGPPIAIIFLFHMTLTGQYGWGGGWMAAWLLLVWQHRTAFTPMWNYRAD